MGDFSAPFVNRIRQTPLRYLGFLQSGSLSEAGLFLREGRTVTSCQAGQIKVRGCSVFIPGRIELPGLHHCSVIGRTRPSAALCGAGVSEERCLDPSWVLGHV